MSYQPEDLENMPFQRGFIDASRGVSFDPSFWGYSSGGTMEYDYARGYAQENDVYAATTVIENYERATAMPVGRPMIREDDGNVLRSAQRR